MSKKSIKFGFIGCGLIANKRAKFIKKNDIFICFDTNQNNSKKFSENYNCKVAKNINEILNFKDLNAVIISTYHNSLASFAIKAYKKKLNVLVEKPGGKDLNQLKQLYSIIKKSNKKNIIQVGYNHRYHPAIIKTLDLLKNKKKTGEIMYIRCRYGHGGRLNYEKEWRANKEISGGGELIDQGSHIIDLSRLLLGNFNSIKSELVTKFWRMNVDDNAFIILKNTKKQIAHLHCSCTEWKNKFNLEIFCKKAKFEVDGLGGSYGYEKLKIYYMKKKMGVPSYKEIVFKEKDKSWKREIDVFKKSIKYKKIFGPSVDDAYQNMKIISYCYKQNKLIK